MPKAKKKTFVLDTNVILHDSACIYQFEENDIVIPITVLEELDRFKKGNESLNYHAREFVRTLDSLSGDKLFDGGVPIGPSQGRISIRLAQDFHPDLPPSFRTSKPDCQILNIALNIRMEPSSDQVILVSKDVNLRMKAKAVGLLAQDYQSDKVKDISSLYAGHRTVESIDEKVLIRMHHEPLGMAPSELEINPDPKPNEYFILRNGKVSVLGVFDPGIGTIRKVDKVNAYGITPRNAAQTFALDALLNSEIKLVSMTGKAGTGKTLLALAAALHKRKQYQQIFIARPVVPLSNKDIGFLPGDIESKMEPYMQPLYDNLAVIRYHEDPPKKGRVDRFLKEEKLVVAPLAFIRGRSLVKVFFIVDEAQNLTPHEVKTIITRAGEDTKIVFTGDIFQIDHPYLDSQSNGLSSLIEKMQGQNLYAHVTLEKGERSELADLGSQLL